MRIAICTPFANTVSPEYFRYVIDAQNASPQHSFWYIQTDSQIVGKARNDLVRRALETNCEVFWFIDDDILVPSDATKVCVAAYELGVCSGLYFNRRPPYTPQIYRLATGPSFTGPNSLYWPILDYDTELMQVDAVGAGCLAVRRDVFEKLQKLPVVRAYGIPLSPWFEFLDAKGEDLYFCERLRDIGQAVWVDPTVKCEHLSYVPLGEANYKFVRPSLVIENHEDPVPAPA